MLFRSCIEPILFGERIIQIKHLGGQTIRKLKLPETINAL